MQRILAFLLLAGVCGPASAQNTTATVVGDEPTAGPFPLGEVATPPESIEEAVPGTEVSGETASPVAPSDSSNVTFGGLVADLPTTVQNCAQYMGSQRPNETDYYCDKFKKTCEKSQGQIPVLYEGTTRDDTQETPEEPIMDVSLAACIAQCTVARDCNYVTYKIATSTSSDMRGGVTCRCRSYKINSDCHLDQDDKDCFVESDSPDALGMDLGECPFSAKPEGGLADKTWALFRKVRSSTSDGLAVAASVLTILTAVLGAPFTAISRLFKA